MKPNSASNESSILKTNPGIPDMEQVLSQQMILRFESYFHLSADQSVLLTVPALLWLLARLQCLGCVSKKI